MVETEKPLINLATDDMTLCMIVKGPSGVRYSNQVGGTACAHPKVEGWYVPLFGYPVTESQLITFTTGCWPGCLTKLALDQIDAALRISPLPLRLDHEALADEALPDDDEPTRGDDTRYGEAWLPVVIEDDRQFQWEGLKGKAAILTWGNSD